MLRLATIAASLSSNVRDAASAARRFGFRGILLDSHSFTLDLVALSATGKRELRQVISNQNLEIVGVRVDTGLKGFSPGADIDRLLSRLEKAIEAAAGLQAPLVTIDLGPLPPARVVAKPRPKIDPALAGFLILPTSTEQADASPAEPKPRSPADEAFASSVAAGMFELGRLADRFNVRLAFSASLANFASLAEAVASAACPWFGIDLDAAATVPSPLADDWPIDDVFSRFGNDLLHVRARDAVRGSDGRTRSTVVGKGQVDWPGLVARLHASDYNGFVTIDPTEIADRPRAIAAAIDVLTRTSL